MGLDQEMQKQIIWGTAENVDTLLMLEISSLIAANVRGTCQKLALDQIQKLLVVTSKMQL